MNAEISTYFSGDLPKYKPDAIEKIKFEYLPKYLLIV